MIEASLFGKKRISEVLFFDQYKKVLWHFYEVSEAYYSNKYLKIQGINDDTNMKRYKVYLTLYKAARLIWETIHLWHLKIPSSSSSMQICGTVRRRIEVYCDLKLKETKTMWIVSEAFKCTNDELKDMQNKSYLWHKGLSISIPLCKMNQKSVIYSMLQDQKTKVHSL